MHEFEDNHEKNLPHVPGLIMLVLLLGTSSLIYGQDSISLSGIWQFKPGDDLRYAKSSFDDAAWDTIRADKIWEEQGYEKLDGYAWFRLRVFLPSSLRDRATLKDGLRICLGKINNFDQSFLNGTLFGMNGKTVEGDTPIDTLFTRAETIMWNHERVCVLPFDDPRLTWNEENVTAKRFPVSLEEIGFEGAVRLRDAWRQKKLGDFSGTFDALVPSHGVVLVRSEKPL